MERERRGRGRERKDSGIIWAGDNEGEEGEAREEERKEERKKRKKSKKKRKTSHSQLAESPGGESKANIGLNSQLANENLKLEPPLPVENVEKKINKSRITKNSVNREIFKRQLQKRKKRIELASAKHCNFN